MKQLSILSTKFYAFLGTNYFFYASLGFFLIGVLWMLFASLYPMAFDEEFHLGLIQIYSTSLIPYGIETNSNMAQYGAATADPSYLFHYLLSWPYRILVTMQLPIEVVIIILRLISLGFIIGSLFIYRLVLEEAGASRRVSNLTLAVFMFIPTLAMLAAQINYDSLLLLIVAICCLLTIRMTKHVKQYKQFPAKETWLLALFVLIGLPVKNAFLPLAVGFFVWTIALVLFTRYELSQPFSRLLHRFYAGTKVLSKNAKITLIIFGMLGIFFSAHYVTNFISYGTPFPKCDDVFSKQACTAYGPWNRNQQLAQNLDSNFQPKSIPLYITRDWLPGMAQRLTFAVAGKSNSFQTKQPFLLVLNGFIILSIIGALFLGYQLLVNRRISMLLPLTVLLTTLYCGILIYQLYGSYSKTGVPVAINGRYLLPLLPLAGAVLIQAFSLSFRRVPTYIKSITAITILLFFSVIGSGWATYIISAEAHWFWPGLAQSTHQILQTLLDTVTIQLKN